VLLDPRAATAVGEEDGRERERQVDEEDPAPRDPLDDDAAERRSADRDHAREGGPEPDGAARVGAVRLPEERQAVGRHEGTCDPLQRPGRDQDAAGGRRACERRSGGEADDPEHERLTASAAIADRTGRQIEGRERERVGEKDPLLAGEAEAEVAVDRRQRDDDDARVDERERRSEYGGGERHAPERVAGHGE
jgi:hypothetical protein